MPQGTNAQRHSSGRKSTRPAHQNAFAFRHNPKSRKTEKILASPIVGVCRRCHEKLEWRKRYRKYKPLTQPSSCNICKRRNVTQAYHTICFACCTSSQALTAVEKAQNERRQGEVPQEDDGVSEDEEEGKQQRHLAEDNSHDDENVSVATTSNRTFRSTRGRGRRPPAESKSSGSRRRACGVCVKDYVAVGKKDQEDDSKKTLQEEVMARQAGGRALKLREIKSLERKMMQEEEDEGGEQGDDNDKEEENHQHHHHHDIDDDDDCDDEDDSDEDDDSDCDDDEDEEQEEELVAVKQGKPVQADDNDDDDDDDFEDALDDICEPVLDEEEEKFVDQHDDDDDDDAMDPFLQAVGGKILVGEEYRRAKLLQAAARGKASA